MVPSSLTDLISQLELYYQGAHERMLESEKKYEGRFDDLFENFDYPVPIHSSSTARSIVDGFRNQIRTDQPTVDFTAIGPSKIAQAEASKMQRWGREMMVKERTFSDVDPNLQAGFDGILRGAACKKILVDVEKIVGRMPRKNSKEYDDWYFKATMTWPFISRAVDPMSVFPAPGQIKPLRFIVEKQHRILGDLMEYVNATEEDEERGVYRFNPNLRDKPSDKEKWNLASMVTWLEYWDNENYVVEADGQRIVMKPNPYGFVPYIFEWSGLGRRNYDGDPKSLAVSILTAYIGELEAEVILKTGLSAQTLSHIFPTILTTEDPNVVASKFAVGPARVIQHPPGQPPVFMQAPEPNPNILVFLEKVMENMSTIRNVAIAGGRQPGVGYGILQAQLLGQALKHMSPVRMVLDRMGGETLNMMARMMKKMEINMNLAGSQEEQEVMVKGEEFNHYNFKVQFEVVDPAEDDRALMVGEAMRRAGDLSQRTFWKQYAKHIVNDADEEEASLYAEMVMKQLAASGMLTQVVLSEDQKEQIAATAQGAVDTAKQGLEDRNVPQQELPQPGQAVSQQVEQLSGLPNLVQQPMAEAATASQGAISGGR